MLLRRRLDSVYKMNNIYYIYFMYKYNILYNDDWWWWWWWYNSNICMHENTRKQKLRQHNKYFLCFMILFKKKQLNNCFVQNNLKGIPILFYNYYRAVMFRNIIYLIWLMRACVILVINLRSIKTPKSYNVI